MLRKIVQIDEERCDGCGLCVPSCAEGAITMVDGKARLAADNLCDGLGACLGECPLDAIRVIERDADEFDENAVERHLNGARHESGVTANSNVGQGHSESGGCPGSRLMNLSPAPREFALTEQKKEPSLLCQWLVQFQLVPANAPFLQDAYLLIAADCVPFAYAGFHRD